MRSQIVSKWMTVGAGAAIVLLASPRCVFAAATATGGTITTNGHYITHTFTPAGDATFEVSGGSLSCQVLVVAGGGSGGPPTPATAAAEPAG
jgi:hypothetical protein